MDASTTAPWSSRDSFDEITNFHGFASKVERCHGLVPWSFTFAATCPIKRNSWMPRPCAVEVHVFITSYKREAPRDKPVASSTFRARPRYQQQTRISSASSLTRPVCVAEHPVNLMLLLATL